MYSSHINNAELNYSFKGNIMFSKNLFKFRDMTVEAFCVAGVAWDFDPAVWLL
jgi:hypothetical protein